LLFAHFAEPAGSTVVVTTSYYEIWFFLCPGRDPRGL